MSKKDLQASVEEYLRLPYTIQIQYDDTEGNPGWVAWVEELPGCMTYADTKEEIMDMIQDAMRLWIETALERGKSVPLPKTEERKYSGRFVVRVPKSLHRKIVRRAEREGASLNQWIATTLAEAVGKPSPATSHPAANVPRWPGLALIAQTALQEADQAEIAAEQDEHLVAMWLQDVVARFREWLKRNEFQEAQSEIQRALDTLRPYTTRSSLVHALVQLLTAMDEIVDNVENPSIATAVRRHLGQEQGSYLSRSRYPEGTLAEVLFEGVLEGRNG